MKTNSYKFRLYKSATIKSTIFLIAITLTVNIVNAQICTNPPTQGAATAWVKNASVTVNISPTFTSTQRQAIEDVFDNWAGVATSGVTFSFTSSSTPVNTQNSYQVNSQNPTSCTCQAETGGGTSGGRRYNAFTNLHTGITNTTALKQAMSHEIGHTFGLDDCTTCAAGTSAMTLAPSLNDTTNGRDNPSTCDSNAALPYYQTPTPTPTPTPSPTPPIEYDDCVNTYGYYWNFNNSSCTDDRCWYVGDQFCPNEYCFDTWECTCIPGYTDPRCGTPIVIDVAGNGFNLTGRIDGVLFDLSGTGIKEKWSWTAAGSDDSWLVFDRNGNGLIEDGKEMFGNFTPQSDPPAGCGPNGFLALAEYDKPANGGNNDSAITKRDTIFARLRLWQDTNHNGVSEASELSPLSSFGVARIDLDYRESRRRDSHGNRFRFRAKLKNKHGSQVGGWAWDVYLVLQK